MIDFMLGLASVATWLVIIFGGLFLILMLFGYWTVLADFVSMRKLDGDGWFLLFFVPIAALFFGAIIWWKADAIGEWYTKLWWTDIVYSTEFNDVDALHCKNRNGVYATKRVSSFWRGTNQVHYVCRSKLPYDLGLMQWDTLIRDDTAN